MIAEYDDDYVEDNVEDVNKVECWRIVSRGQIKMSSDGKVKYEKFWVRWQRQGAN